MIVHLPHPPRVAYRRIVVAIALLLALAGVFVPTNATARANTAAAPPPCRAADLDAATTHQGMTDATILSILFTVAQPATVCTLSGQPGVRLSDATGAFLVASTPPDLAIGQPVTLSSGSGASISVRWSNWCGARAIASNS